MLNHVLRQGHLYANIFLHSLHSSTGQEELLGWSSRLFIRRCQAYFGSRLETHGISIPLPISAPRFAAPVSTSNHCCLRPGRPIHQHQFCRCYFVLRPSSMGHCAYMLHPSRTQLAVVRSRIKHQSMTAWVSIAVVMPHYQPSKEYHRQFTS